MRTSSKAPYDETAAALLDGGSGRLRIGTSEGSVAPAWRPVNGSPALRGFLAAATAVAPIGALAGFPPALQPLLPETP